MTNEIEQAVDRLLEQEPPDFDQVDYGEPPEPELALPDESAYEQLFRVHNRFGLVKYGQARWNNANVGWNVVGDESVTSKVYGGLERDTVVFTTDRVGDHFEHSEDVY